MYDRHAFRNQSFLNQPSHRHLGAKVFTIFWVLVLAYAPVALAGSLKVETQATVKTKKDRLEVTASAHNRGNEAAHNVQTSILFLDKRLESPIRPVLGANESEVFHVEKVISGIKPGRYPLTVLVDFQDANQYAFSALVGTTFHYEKDVNPDLLCVVNSLVMGENDELRVQVRNLGVESRHIRATILLPKELSAPKTETDFEIAPRGEKTVFFEVVNFSALPGATYPVFCFLEYDSKETHYTAVANTVIEIVEKQNWLGRTVWLWIGLAIFLGMVIILYQFKKK